MTHGTENWSLVAALNDLDPDYPLLVKVDGKELALCLVEDEVFAVENICSHAFARLSDGFVEGFEIFCPLHQGSFDLRSGQAVASPCTEPIKKIEAKEIGGNVYVDASQVACI